MADGTRQFLRHTLATLAYRSSRALRGAPWDFAETRVQPDTRSAVEIVAHLGDLLEWAVSSVQGDPKWNPQPPGAWQTEIDRFYTAMQKLDDLLAGEAPLGCPAEQLFQGPIADALTHVGQLSTLRRVAGSSAGSENFFIADIAIGKVGREQSPAKYEFD
jgi:hypothetical protein